MDALWALSVLLRLSWTLYGQTGYIHPDEFFQSTEVIAGDVLDVQHTRTWEFTSTNPIRSITSWYALCGWPLALLRGCARILAQPITSHLALLVPRLVMTLLSIKTDYVIASIASLLGYNRRACILVYCTSFIPLVFYTRTFSNTLESFLFIWLLHLVLRDTTIHTHAHSKTSEKDKKLLKNCDDVPSNIRCFAFVMVCGVFNRPTFLAFALVPVAFWIDQLSKRSMYTYFTKFIMIVVNCAVYATFFSLFIIICDSCYYRKTSVTDLLLVRDVATFKHALSKLTITPVNFLMYNIDLGNLEEHGLHNNYNHVLINVPMLFNVLGMFAVVRAGRLLYEVAVGSVTMDTHKILLMMCYFVPLGILSAFPHQEPRFLIPLLAPLVLGFAHDIVGKRSTRFFRIIWIIVNLICAFVYGSFHQGGVVQSLDYLQNQAAHDSKCVAPTATGATHLEPRACEPHEPQSVHNIIYYHTYMPPQHLLLQPSKTSDSFPTLCYNVIDMKGATHKDLISKLKTLINTSAKANKTIVIAPSSMSLHFCDVPGMRFLLRHHFSNHLSGENPPNDETITCENDMSIVCGRMCSEFSYFERLRMLTRLNMYQVVL